MTAQAQTHGFQTEARQLLKLMIHSLYSNREIFLRELISNASDAIDKLRFRSIAEPDLVGAGEEFAITVRFDKDAKTVTVEDNGIGMTRRSPSSSWAPSPSRAPPSSFPSSPATSRRTPT